ncbi:Aquaporin-1 [Halotydeus destructor]|nr:Aquaporin-1 [Halotydeus destructor]
MSGRTMLDYMRSLPREVSFKEEVSSYQFWKSVRTEFLCSVLFTLISVGSVMNYASLPPTELTGDTSGLGILEVKVSIVSGSLVATLMYVSSGHIAHYQSCHVTPTITFTSFLVREMSLFKLSCFMLVQILGSLLATTILYALSAYDAKNGHYGLGALVAARQLPESNIFGFEFITSFLIVLTYLRVTDHHHHHHLGHRGPEVASPGALGSASVELSETNGQPGSRTSCSPSAGSASLTPLSYLAFLYVGLATAATHMFSFRYTGCGFNPARTLASAIFTNTWTNHWLYWVGPLLGGAFSGFTYDYIRSTKVKLSRSASQQNHHSIVNTNNGDQHVLTVRHEAPSETSPFESEITTCATNADFNGRY